jgi:hypothetical protein
MEDIRSVSNEPALSLRELPMNLELTPTITYELDSIKYQVTIKNNSSDPIGGVKLEARVSNNLFSFIESTAKVEMLDASATITLELKLKSERFRCGKTDVYGKLKYFDFEYKCHRELSLPTMTIVLLPPQELKPYEVQDLDLRISMIGYPKLENETEAIEIAPETLFNYVTDTLKTMGFYMLEPLINPSVYRAIGKFHAIDNVRARYAVYVEVIGKPGTQSKILIRSWADTPQQVMALHYNILTTLDKKIQIKNYIIPAVTTRA